MRSYLVLAVLMVATAVAFYVVWMNRSSEKIISAVIPISAAALLGVFMAVFVFGGEAPETVEFPTTFIFRSSDNLPVMLPFRPQNHALFLISQLGKSNPDMLKDDAQGSTLYHHFLQRAIIETLAFRYAGSWETKIVRFDTSLGSQLTAGPAEDASEPKEKISGEELDQKLSGNRFAQVHTVFNWGLVVPPSTTLEIRPPMADQRLGEVSSIIFDNPFVRLTIQTRASQWGVLFGGYRLMLGQPSDTNTDLRQATYVVSIKKEFKRLRTGQPDMPRYRAWAQQIAEELQTEYDEQRIWAKAKEEFLFSRQLPVSQVPPILVPQAPETK
jgi:hypothetical protein